MIELNYIIKLIRPTCQRKLPNLCKYRFEIEAVMPLRDRQCCQSSVIVLSRQNTILEREHLVNTPFCFVIDKLVKWSEKWQMLFNFGI